MALATLRPIKMRELTHYEVAILIEHEVEKLNEIAHWPEGITRRSISIIHAQSQSIIKYCEEFNGLPEMDD